MQAASAAVFIPPVLAPGVQAAWLVQAVHGQGERPADRLLHHARWLGMVVESETEEINAERRALPRCCSSRATTSARPAKKAATASCRPRPTIGMMAALRPLLPDRPVDASHPDVLLDFNRCILCSLCVRASRDVDGKNVFALGRGITRTWSSMPIRPVGRHRFHAGRQGGAGLPGGVILKKRRGFAVPIGERTYDKAPIAETVKEGMR
jgi:[NiFe] hydrogenase diaphorase moiety small subunit